MSDTKLNYNEFDADARTPKDLGYQDGVVIDLNEWPAEAESDERLYRLAWTPNMRAVVTAIGGDVLLADDEGAPQFEPVDPNSDMASLPESLATAIEGKTGSYRSMSKLAVHLNKLQEGPAYLYRSFNFFPDPISEVKAA